MTVNVGDPARLMSVSISRELLQLWMTEGWTVGGETLIRCTRGLPEGARVAWQTVPAQPVELVFEHESFPLIRYGERIPAMICEFSAEEGE